MNEINGLGPFKHPVQLMQKLRAEATPSNDMPPTNITKDDFLDKFEGSALSSEKLEKVFNRIDHNNDGEISIDERQDLIHRMEQRMHSLRGRVITQPGFEPIRSLMGVLRDQTNDQQQVQRLDSAIERIQNNQLDEQLMQESLSLIEELLPGVNTSV